MARRVYISGKITGTDDYMERFEAAERGFASQGFEVVNPARVCAQLPETFTHSEYMRVCLAMLRACDCVYMIPGYEDSEGAREEELEARIAGVEIIYGKE